MVVWGAWSSVMRFWSLSRCCSHFANSRSSRLSCIYTYMYIYIYAYIHIYTSDYMFTHTNMRVCMHVCTYVRRCTYINIKIPWPS
jgi:hypothetical protein